MCHIHDTVTLYIEILRNILNEKKTDHGRDGYYLASPGAIAWLDLYQQMAKALAKRGVVEDDKLHNVSVESLEEAAKALGCPEEFVPVEMGGSYVSVNRRLKVFSPLTNLSSCTLQADRGKKIGWQPKYSAQHILEDADNEVELILSNI